MYDILFKNVRVVDGTGSPWFYAEVAVKGDTIFDVAHEVSGKAKRVVDGKNMILSPGFIDAHSHSDVCWFADKRGESKIRQGVTTEITGQCGSSPAPVTEKGKSGVSPLDKTDLGKEQWPTFSQYLLALQENGSAINIAPLVGHGTLRSSAMGYEDRPPLDKELEMMKSLFVEALECGAFGFSSGLIYPPGCYADTSELVEIAKVMAPYGGIYETHMRNENVGLLDSVNEAIRIGREAKVAVQISHHKATREKAWGLVNDSLKLVEGARSQGLDVTCNQYPYTASSTGFKAILPAWAHDGGPEALLTRLKDPVISRRIQSDVEAVEGPNNGWPKMLITLVKTKENEFAVGKRIPELASIFGLSNVETAVKLLVEEELEVGYVEFGMCEEDVRTVMVHPCVMFGSDSSCTAIDGPLAAGKPHPRAFGTFPRVLGKYVREEKILTLENAIFKMTGMPASRFRLMDRGLIRPGMKADLTLFDPKTIIERSTYEDPVQYPKGIEYVMVNGVFTLENCEHTGKIAGRVLKRK